MTHPTDRSHEHQLEPIDLGPDDLLVPVAGAVLDGEEDLRRLVAFVRSAGLGEVPPDARIRPSSPRVSRTRPREIRPTRRGVVAAMLVGAVVLLTTSVGVAMQRGRGAGAPAPSDADTFAAVDRR